jgi:hypothetical protein
LAASLVLRLCLAAAMLGEMRSLRELFSERRRVLAVLLMLRDE